MTSSRSFCSFIIAFLMIEMLSVAGVRAQDSESFSATVDSLAPELLETYSVPGAAVALIENGEIVHLKGYGFADIQNGVPVAANTRFRIGSLTKTFTAWGVMTLVEDGVVALDAPVSDYISRWKIPPSTYDDTRVTLRRLLSHTAGTSVEFYDPYVGGEQVPDLPELLSGTYRPEEAVTLIEHPGLQWTYSGGGYSVVQLAVEDVTGDTFEGYMQRAVFDPMDLNDTSFEPSSTDATGHDALRQSTGNVVYPSLAASGLFSTIADMATFAAAGLGSTADSGLRKDILSEESIRTMQASAPDTRGGYGLGYSTRLTPEGDAVVGHGAAMEGWHANVAIMPARGKGIVILTNSTSGGNVSTQIRCAWYADIIGVVLPGACKTDIAALLVRPLMSEGVDAAIALYRDRVDQPDQYHVDEWQLNGLGYDLLRAGRTGDAVKIFELNVEFFPEAANPHDSLAEAYLEIGERELAITHFRRSLELDPGNDNARDMLAKLDAL